MAGAMVSRDGRWRITAHGTGQRQRFQVEHRADPSDQFGVFVWRGFACDAVVMGTLTAILASEGVELADLVEEG